MERPRVLGLLGSPRAKSNTGLLLDRILAGAEAEGAAIERVDLRTLSGGSCRHCHGCRDSGQCVVQDDVQQVYQRIRAAQHLVLASPIHFAGVTGEMKCFIDRRPATVGGKLPPRAAAHRSGRAAAGIFVATCGGSDTRVFGWAEHTVKSFFNSAAFSYWGTLFEANTDTPPPLAERGGGAGPGEALGRALMQEERNER